MIVLCPSCSSDHLGPDCGMTFRERIGSIQIGPSVMSARMETSGTYVDREALDAQLGGTRSERKERMLEETRGHGYSRRDKRGRWYHHGREGWEPVTEKVAEDIAPRPGWVPTESKGGQPVEVRSSDLNA